MSGTELPFPASLELQWANLINAVQKESFMVIGATLHFIFSILIDLLKKELWKTITTHNLVQRKKKQQKSLVSSLISVGFEPTPAYAD